MHSSTSGRWCNSISRLTHLKKLGTCAAFCMQDSRLRDSPFHGVVSIGASNAESFGLSNPETTPLSIPTNPATPPSNSVHND